MIKIIGGDLLEAKEDILCHQVNCLGQMGAGLAFMIRLKYPKVYSNYRLLCEETVRKKDLLGAVQIVSVGDRSIANLFGQYEYGYAQCNTDYEAFEKAMRSLKDLASDKTLAFPYRIGCGLGGGDWGIILDIMTATAINADITIYKKE
jgi:O-acetyl-ADP-ribose deacetylase (regulator of RNase III)